MEGKSEGNAPLAFRFFALTWCTWLKSASIPPPHQELPRLDLKVVDHVALVMLVLLLWLLHGHSRRIACAGAAGAEDWLACSRRLRHWRLGRGKRRCLIGISLVDQEVVVRIRRPAAEIKVAVEVAG